MFFSYYYYYYYFSSRYSPDIIQLMLAMLKVKPTERPDADWILHQIVLQQNKAENRVWNTDCLEALLILYVTTGW